LAAKYQRPVVERRSTVPDGRRTGGAGCAVVRLNIKARVRAFISYVLQNCTNTYC
jgi:hypothetical protein